MDTMLLGETLRAENGAGHNYTGFWMPAGGNDGVAAVEVYVCNAAEFTVHMQTKSSDEVDPDVNPTIGAGTSIGSVSISSTGAARYRFPVSDAKDLVRYLVVCSAGSASYLHFQLAAPTWSPN